MEEGKDLGRRPELVGGGLIRSLGGWSKVISLRQGGEKQEYDSRVLGSGEFVQALLRGADEGMARQMRSKPRESLWQSGKKKGQNNFDDFEQRPSFCQGCFECPLEPFFFSSCRC